MNKLDWGMSCGRYYLTLNGFVIAMQQDPAIWGETMIKALAKSKKPVSIIGSHLCIGYDIIVSPGSVCRDENFGKVWTFDNLQSIVRER